MMAPRTACVLVLFGLFQCLPGLSQSQPQATATPTATPTPSPTPTPEPDKNAGSTKSELGRMTPMKGDVEILSDTQGVDFGPYLQRALNRIKKNWYNLIPEVAKPPLMKKGSLIIQFAILKDGNVRGMLLQQPSGDVSLDRAAWGGITTSNPFEPLPGQFLGGYLSLRIKFLYNTGPSSTPPGNVFPPQDPGPAPPK